MHVPSRPVEQTTSPSVKAWIYLTNLFTLSESETKSDNNTRTRMHSSRMLQWPPLDEWWGWVSVLGAGVGVYPSENSHKTCTLLAFIAKYGVPTNQWTWFYEALLEVSMTKIALWIRVYVDDWTAESAVKASNVTPLIDYVNSIHFILEL